MKRAIGTRQRKFLEMLVDCYGEIRVHSLSADWRDSVERLRERGLVTRGRRYVDSAYGYTEVYRIEPAARRLIK